MKNKQAGGIVSFIIVAVVLVGLLAGGLYFSKRQARLAHDSDTSTPKVSTTQTSKQEEKKHQSGTNTSNGSNDAATKPQSSTSQNQPQAAPSTSTPKAPSSNRVANTGPSEGLPSTGPTETAAVTLALGALVFTGYQLQQSRRKLRRSALRR